MQKLTEIVFFLSRKKSVTLNEYIYIKLKKKMEIIKERYLQYLSEIDFFLVDHSND